MDHPHIFRVIFMYQTVATITTKACHPIVNHACFTLNNDGVNPVETQNLASHEQKARQRQAFTHLTSLRILACETQEARQRQVYIHLASLRILACETQEARQRQAFTHLTSLRILVCETLEARQRQAFTHLTSLHILACETQNFASLLWITHV